MFAHLHTHSEYSLLDGLSTVQGLAQRAGALGQEALALTDHGALYGALKFHAAARAAGIKPIIGMEAYVAIATRDARGPEERQPYHLTLLARDAEGYRNLLRLSSASHLDGFYQKPRVDRELLEAHSAGLIALSGCPTGEVARALREGREADARAAAGWYRDVFGERYRMEVQHHGDPEFSQLPGMVMSVGEAIGSPVVMTNDSHYTMQAQAEAHDVLLCIGTNSKVGDDKRMRFHNDRFYLTSEEEMRAAGPEFAELCDETVRVAEMVEGYDLDFGRPLLPDPGIPDGLSAGAHLRALCERGLSERYPDASEEQRERLRYELEVIGETGFDEYILIVRDIATFARERSIPMGVRGSAAASIVLHCLGVTDIEPTQYGLVFERFLNPERREMPDVDFDFADERRAEVIRYTAERYGRDRVAQIITFGRLGAKLALRDVGRALEMPYSDVDRIARIVPEGPGVRLESALASPAMVEALGAIPNGERLADMARSLEGVARHASTHAAGVVIAREPLTEVVPLQRATSDDPDALPTTQYDMDDVAAIGLLKLDFLGLANLTLLGDALEITGTTAGAIPEDDEATARMLARGETFGVFQIESPGMRRWVQEIEPAGVRELAAVVALYRPGPLERIPQYVDTKFGRRPASYPHDDLGELLDETYGVITYQDQVLQIAQRFGGYTLGAADVMRKAMGKKVPEVMARERGTFVEGAAERGYDRDVAERIFDLIEPFAGYAFNKAHAFSYATLAWRTAWLKAHHPLAFMAALLRTAGGASGGQRERVARAVAECARMGIEVRVPDLNRSGEQFTIEDDSAVRFGIASVSRVGADAARAIIENREADGPFTSLEDAASRLDPERCTRPVVEALGAAGAFDSLLDGRPDLDRASIVSGADRVMAAARTEFERKRTGQHTMFGPADGGIDVPAVEFEPGTATSAEVAAWELEYLGAYVTEHPFRDAAALVAPWVTHSLGELADGGVRGKAVVAGRVTSVRRHAANGGEACTLTIEDLADKTEVTLWPEARERVPWASDCTGEIVITEIEARERGGRLRVRVRNAALWDAGTGSPAASSTWVPQRRVGTSAAEVESEAPAAQAEGQPGVQAASAGDSAGPERALARGSANGAVAVIEIRETDDVAGDLRRTRAAFAAVEKVRAESAGEAQLRLRVVGLDGSETLLAVGGFADAHEAATVMRAALVGP